jgi:hypothetical protein
VKTAAAAKTDTQDDLDNRSGGGAPQDPPAPPRQAMVTRLHTAPPAELMDDLTADAGKGVSTDQADNLVPLVYILQDQSPQVLRRNPAYIEGAETGCIWLRNAPDPIVPGDVGIEVIPCYFSKDVVEWKPRDDGGGFIARHDFHAGEDIEKLAVRLGATKVMSDPKNPNRIDYILPSGNELVETRYHIVMVVRENGVMMPFVIPLSSTGHTFSKQWMFKYNSKKLPSGKTASSFSSIYRIRTNIKQNASGEWFAFQEDDGQWLWDRFKEEGMDYTKMVLQQCRELHDAFAQGLKQPDMPEDQGSGGAAASTADAEQHI